LTVDTANLPALAQAARDAEMALRAWEAQAASPDEALAAVADHYVPLARQRCLDALRRVQLAAEAALAMLPALPEKAAGPAVESRGPGV
jgi:hypothetical protein